MQTAAERKHDGCMHVGCAHSRAAGAACSATNGLRVMGVWDLAKMARTAAWLGCVLRRHSWVWDAAADCCYVVDYWGFSTTIDTRDAYLRECTRLSLALPEIEPFLTIFLDPEERSYVQ